jgi:hypothetical protein
MWNRAFFLARRRIHSGGLFLQKWKGIVIPNPVKEPVQKESADELLLEIHCYDYTL